MTGLFHCLPQVWSWGEQIGPMRAVLRAVWAIVSAVTGLIGLALMVVAAVRMQQHGIPAAVLEILVGGASVVASADQMRRIWISHDQQVSKRKEETPEQRDASNLILRLARHHKGRLTAAEVAASSDLHYKLASLALEEMAEDGICEVKIGEGGATFYFFPEFASPGLKRDILEEHAFDFDSSAQGRQSAPAAQQVEQVEQEKS